MFVRLRYEARALGLATFAIPLLVTLIYLGFSWIAGYAALRSGAGLSVAHYQALRGLVGLIENGLPLAAGLAVATISGADPALELLLALPGNYRTTGALRLALASLWALLVTGVVSALMVGAGYWPSSLISPAPQGLLIWLAPLLVFVTLGATLALLFRSRVVSAAILALLWIGQFLFKPLFLGDATLKFVYLFLTEEAGITSYWLTNRLTLLALALCLFCATLWLLGRNEWLLGAEA